jgi:hypothetical protein
MASDNVRWRNIREFLDDLPTDHCHVKPGHEFCTVCMRINYMVAHDCPLFHQRPKKKRLPPPPPEEARSEPIKEHLSAADVKQAMKGEDFPIIEFAGPRGTGGHEGEEEIFEVKPMDVKPIAAPPPKAVKKPAKEGTPETEEAKDEPAEAKPATAVKDRDPESIVQEIMEELEFPDGEVLEEDEGKADVEVEGKAKGKDTVEEEDDAEVKEKPPVVEKETVKKRRPKKKK